MISKTEVKHAFQSLLAVIRKSMHYRKTLVMEQDSPQSVFANSVCFGFAVSLQLHKILLICVRGQTRPQSAHL